MSATPLGLPRSRRGRSQRKADLKRALEHGLFGFGPVAATLALLAFQFKINAVALDFRVAYWPAASRLLHGLSPYAVSHAQIVAGTAFVYPALSAVVFAPFALVGNGVAQVLYMLVCVACIPAILRVLNVRDWRIYGLVMLWLPVFDGWQSGNVTLPLTLLTALIWRYRERAVVAGVLTALAISLKPFVWPLGLWLLVTRRWRAAAWALGSGLAINLVVWAIVGFNEIHTYLRLSSAVTDALWRGGYSMVSVAGHLGLGRATGEGLLLVTSAAAVAAVIYLGTVRRRERDALVMSVLLMLLASPLLWAHYFSLLLIPLAFSRPRLSPLWGIGLLMWPMPPRQPVHGWEELLAWSVTAICVWASLREGPVGRWPAGHRPEKTRPTSLATGG
ncbi:MAG TPA: glycosyltransferase family 87 protein [Solirubrobacteraceae bacterium]|nr:glycosyltransferase family 87 protein [Solirubrobacteraceae bacterium]